MYPGPFFRAGTDGGAEASLKFWDRTTGAAGQGLGPLYSLNTQVDDPHRGAVTCLAHHPSADVAVTTGHDGDFRVWARQGASRRSRTAQAAPRAHWQCRSVASYRGVPFPFPPPPLLLLTPYGPEATVGFRFREYLTPTLKPNSHFGWLRAPCG